MVGHFACCAQEFSRTIFIKGFPKEGSAAQDLKQQMVSELNSSVTERLLEWLSSSGELSSVMRPIVRRRLQAGRP